MKKIYLLLACILPLCGCIEAINRNYEKANSAKEQTSERTASASDALLNTVTPAGTPSQIKEYEGFTVSFNRDNGTPNWVAWHLAEHEVSGATSRKGADFWQDTSVRGCPAKQDYTRSGFDRGHMCPAGDMKWSPEAMHDCFSMANICPQDGALNRGAWQTLETKEREWASRDGGLYIVAGPVYEEADRSTIAGGRVRVPGAFFKVLLAMDAGEPRAIGFVYPNMTAPGNMKNYAMSVDKVENITGLDFFSALPDDVENAVEASFSWRDWIRR